MKYTQEEQNSDNERVENAFEALDAFRKQFGDIVKFDALTITDVGNVVMNGISGPVAAKDIYSRDELLAALEVIADSPGADIEEAICIAVNDYRETHQTKESET